MYNGSSADVFVVIDKLLSAELKVMSHPQSPGSQPKICYWLSSGSGMLELRPGVIEMQATEAHDISTV